MPEDWIPAEVDPLPADKWTRESIYRAFGRRLREIRLSRGFTQRVLAELMRREWLHGSQSAIAKMERGERSVSLEHLYLLADSLGVQPAELLPEIPLEERMPRYHVRVCSCPEGPYYGAMPYGTPIHCERCGFLTREQIDLIKKGFHE